MRLFALSDPHLSLGTPGKTMDRFGPQWVDHTGQMARAWDATVGDDDLVLLPGDISWARDAAQVAPDLAWIAERPGTKVLAKGNHEHWWGSKAKVRKLLPDGILCVDGDAVRVGDVALCGTRLWENAELGAAWQDRIAWVGEPISPAGDAAALAAAEKVWAREVGRLQRALASLDPAASLRVALVHYPPVTPDVQAGELTSVFAAARVQHVVYGHVHALHRERRPEPGAERDGVRYWCTSCDTLDFAPVCLAEV